MASCKSCGSKRMQCKSDALINHIGVISHHLESLLSATELSILCPFICRVGYVDAQIRETLLHK